MMIGEDNQRWIKYYSPAHNILLVGEGDFSFSLCLGQFFGSATNIVATSLDTYDALLRKYKYANDNLVILKILGATVLHGVDATRMMTHPELQLKKFHRIIYNFPHAGFHGKEDNPAMVMMHRDLVRGFLQNASSMLDFDGEIHVTHKTTAPFDRWKIEDLGSECSLVCIAQDEFRIQDYPGYENKRGASPRADEPFPLGACKTYRFRLAVSNPIMRKKHLMPQMFSAPVGVPQPPPMAPFASQLFPTPPPPPPPLIVQHQPPSMPIYDDGAASRYHASDQCRGIFGTYLNHAEETFGDSSYDVRRSVEETLWFDYEKYVSSVVPGKRSSSFASILEELRQMQFLHELR